jgi:uncharacterized protein YbbC (DUF1343 family)
MRLMRPLGSNPERLEQQIFPIATGLDHEVADSFARLRGQRVGILCHPASVDQRFVHILDRALEAKLEVAALFGPEHGITGFAQDMDAIAGERDARFACPVHSLYGSSAASLSPTPEMLAGLDTVLIDLLDIGTRYYTFVWTAVLMLRACGRANVKVVVLDRPNPLGGLAVEGGGVDQGFFSFVGLYDVPVRHGLTIGEMLALVKREENLGTELEVVHCSGWQRQRLAASDYAWVYPSPNMPTLETAIVYPGMCLLEATNVSEGRGTTRPFEVFGAPFVDGRVLARELTQLGEPGAIFRPIQFRPMFQKFARELCGGVQLHVTDASAFRSFRVGVEIVRALQRLYPRDFAWRREPYEFVADVNAFDLLAGTADYREAFADEGRFTRVVAEREERAAAFLARRRGALLY